MGVLIDPYMFELSDEQEIENNISFFQTIIKFHTQVGQNRNKRVILYKGMIDKMHRRSIQPFPINIQSIADPDLRKVIMQINREFNHTLLRSLDDVADIDACSGEQEFAVAGDNEIAEDPIYYEMLCVLLLPCYSGHVTIDDRIMTGSKSCGRQIGDHFQIQCGCHEKVYIKNCVFSGIDELVSPKERVVKIFKE